MNKNTVTALPDVPSVKYDEMKPQPVEKSRLARLQHMSPEEAAREMLNDLCSGKAGSNPASCQYKADMSSLDKEFKGCRASNFIAKKSGDYAGVYVFYLLTRPDGKTEKSHICIRKDNDQHIWIADGGL